MGGWRTLHHGVVSGAAAGTPVQGSIDVRSVGGAWGYPDGWNDNNDIIAYYSGDATRIIWNNLLFPLDIPGGATILAATFTPYARDTNDWGNTTITAGAEQADGVTTPIAPGDYATRYDNRGATVTWAPGSIGVVSAPNPIAGGADIAAVVQEIVNRPGFTQGDNISLLMHGAAGAPQYYSSHGDAIADAGLYPRLQVTFEAIQ